MTLRHYLLYLDPIIIISSFPTFCPSSDVPRMRMFATTSAWADNGSIAGAANRAKRYYTSFAPARCWITLDQWLQVHAGIFDNCIFVELLLESRHMYNAHC